jgi:hypothetical protein
LGASDTSLLNQVKPIRNVTRIFIPILRRNSNACFSNIYADPHIRPGDPEQTFSLKETFFKSSYLNDILSKMALSSALKPYRRIPLAVGQNKKGAVFVTL